MSAKEFLMSNGFSEGEEGVFINDMGSVVISDNGYEVANNEGGVMYSYDFNIYWLIGVLTYRGFIDKNYNKPK